MRPNIRAFVQACTQELPLVGPVLEVGSYQVTGQEDVIDLRQLFEGLEYVGTDMRDGPGVDRVEDVMDLTFADDTFGTVVLLDTLEHVEDPALAMQEVLRVTRPDGVVIASSVMDFPIHGHPSDYWRFTPEAFRGLVADCGTAATYAAGPEDYPHTVTLVASPAGELPQLEALTAALEGLDVPQPPAMGAEHRRLVHLLSRQVVRGMPQPDGQDGAVALDWPLDRPAWTIVDGSWIDGSLAAQPTGPVVVRAGEAVIASLTAVEHDGGWRFRGQARPRGVDHTGSLTVHLGDGPPVLETPPGVVVGSLERHTGMRLHALDRREAPLDANSELPLDENSELPLDANSELPLDANSELKLDANSELKLDANSELERGTQLVARLREAGDEVAVDLGCGFRKNGTVGIDVTRDGTDADLVCRAGFEPLPLPAASVDSVYCRDFLEHIPKAVWRDDALQYPVIDLMNEIWRVMRPGAEFLSLTPGYPEPEVHQDPTHVSVWVENSFGYFTGQYPVARAYGVRCNFDLVSCEWDRFYLRAVLRKPTGLPS